MTEDGKLDLEDLKMMSSAIISNTMAAEVLRMDPGRLAEYARTGQLGWKVLAPEDGSRVYHSRKDFIRFWTGEPNNEPPEPEEPSAEKMLAQIWEALMDIRILLKAIVNDKKPAGAATPTD